MPEGPEVQTIVSGLHARIAGAKINSFILSKGADNLFENTTPQDFLETVNNASVNGVHRHGKYIDIELSSKIHIVTHLLMTGQLIYKDNQDIESRPKFLRCVFQFDNGAELCLSDKSTWVKWVVLPEKEALTYGKFNELGIDIFNSGFTLDAFRKLIKSGKAIHSLLLDQHIISGLGNIYVNEVLFLAGIHPSRRAKEISADEIAALYFAIRHVTAQALRHKGTTFSDYRTPDGSKGQYQRFLKVFQRSGKPCPRCQLTIEKTQVGGRGAYYCRKCQPFDNMPAVNAVESVDDMFDGENATAIQNMNSIFIITGASSSGKTTLANQIISRVPFVQVIPTVKTREPREGEVEGKDGIFVSAKDFANMKERNAFVINGTFHGNSYGTPRHLIDNTLSEGKDCVIVLSVEGAKEIKDLYSNAFIIHLTTASDTIQQNRIMTRQDYNESDKLLRTNEFYENADNPFADISIQTNDIEQTFIDALNFMYKVRCRTD